MLPVLLTALLFSADPAASAPNAGGKPVGQQPKTERKICRDGEQKTGSNRIQRICKTPTEWAKHDEGHSADDLKSLGSR